MRDASMAAPREPDRTARLGRALIYLHQQDGLITNPVIRAQMEKVLLAGRAMDFAARLRNHGRGLTGVLAQNYAMHTGIGVLELLAQVLPALQAAGVIAYASDGTSITHIEEYVGVSGSLITQAMAVLDALSPTADDFAVLHSVEIACWAPLARSDHVHALASRGFSDQRAEGALTMTVAAGANQTVYSAALNEDVIYSPNVWGSPAVGVDIASFLRSLGPAERESLLGIAEQASAKPALAVSSYSAFDPAVLRSATQVGLVQAATVRSSFGSAVPQTYVFSPMQESLDDTLVTTEALHLRKLFVAHILYGRDRAATGRGKIVDPVILVDRLLRRGRVGPASNIATDYRLLEAHGIVSVSAVDGGRAFLEAVKPEIIEGGLAWLEASFGDSNRGDGALERLRPPAEFTGPEAERARTVASGAAAEISGAAVLRLREAVQEAQRAARFDY